MYTSDPTLTLCPAVVPANRSRGLWVGGVKVRGVAVDRRWCVGMLVSGWVGHVDDCVDRVELVEEKVVNESM